MTPQTTINRRGMAAMTSATAAFAVNDACMKYLVATLPVSQVMVLRGIVSAVIVFLLVARARQLTSLPEMRRGSVLLRATLEASVVLVYMQALRQIPLGLATGILQATPLMITAVAAVFGRETVSPARWLAVIVGFVGVLMIIQPSTSGIDPAMALAVFTAMIVTARDLSNRLVPPRVPLLVIVLAASIGNTLAGGLLSLAPGEIWHAPTQTEWAVIALAAIVVLIATAMVTFAFRGTEVSAVSPFRYAGVPVAVLIGFLVWGDLPNLLAAGGILIVVGAGIFAMRDEAKRAKGAIAPLR